MEKLELSYTAVVASRTEQEIQGGSLAVPQKNPEFTLDQVILPIGTHPREMKIYVHTKRCL